MLTCGVKITLQKKDKKCLKLIKELKLKKGFFMQLVDICMNS